MRDSFVVYRSFYESLQDLPKKDRGVLLAAIFEYVLNDVIPTNLTGANSAVWKLIKPQLDANNTRYENGTKGGRKKQFSPNRNVTETEPKPNRHPNRKLTDTLTETEPNVNGNVNDNVNANVNGNDNAASETEKNQKPLNNIFEDIDKGCVAVSKWFERIAYPKDKKHLYPDIITDENRIVWAEQWCEISQHPTLAKYSAEQRNRPFAAYDDRQNLTQSFLKTLVEFAFVIKRDTYGEYFKDLNYLIEERNGKLNIDNLATAYQRWLSGEEKKTRDMFPTLGN